jgi:hypothetical protein
MIVQNRQIWANVPFDEYLQMGGWSHSRINAEGKDVKIATPKMLLGTDVDNYLTSPEQYHHENIEIVKPLALALKRKIGDLWKSAFKQPVVRCQFVSGGLVLEYLGRCDMLIPDILEIDFKVSSVPLAVSIPRFGYDNQQNGYIAGFGVKAGMIMRIDPKLKRGQTEHEIEIYTVPINTTWWDYQIARFGKPV